MLAGSLLGIFLAVELDEKYIHFETRAPLPAQLVKALGGLVIVLGVRAGLKPVLAALCGDAPYAGCIRYFFVTFVAAGIWPMTFTKLNRIGQKN